jgi:hypothetical protein
VLDTVAPTDPTIASADPAINIPTNDASVDLAWNAGTDGSSGVTGYSWIVDMVSDTVPDQTLESGLPETIDLDSGNGNYYIHASTQDGAGNWTSTYHHGPWQLDTMAPTATISGMPETPTDSTEVTVTVGGADVVAYMYRLDDTVYGDEIPVSSPISLSGLSEGLHTIHVVGKDAAGNWQATSESTEASWEINLVLPGDINDDGSVDLVDALLACQIACAVAPGDTIFESADTNGDDKLGAEEVVYILQSIAGTRGGASTSARGDGSVEIRQ